MKKFLVIGGIALAVLMVLAASVAVFWVGRASAQIQTPSAPSWGLGMGARGGRGGGMMGAWRSDGDQSHDTALQKAVEAGVITQEQADWMEQHHEQMGQNDGLTNGFGMDPGGCMSGGRGPRGGWKITPTPEP